jgi:lactate dehydrogenase-like 2-hydroxyacid dehydrogenase
MQTGKRAAPVLVLAAIPADLRQALAAQHTLVELSALGPGALPGYSVAVTTSMAGVDTALLGRLPDLKLVACNGAGLDRIDMAAAASRGITVANTPDELTEDTGDFAVALLYGIARRVVEADRFVRDGRWARERMAPGVRLGGKAAGIVGLGRIGQVVARKLAGIGMHVAYTGPREKPGLPWRYQPDLLSLATGADVLVLCMPGGAATHHIIDAAVLAALGPKGFLINIARGSVVDEAALLDALESRAIAGAGLDVFAAEPGLDDRFLTLRNVVLAPHYASLTHETRAAMIARLSAAIAGVI